MLHPVAGLRRGRTQKKREQRAEEALYWQTFERLRRHPTEENWAALVRYQEQGYLAIDNNLSERTLRAIAIGRHNWVVLGSENGGETAAVLYSVVGTCKHLGIDPFLYLREALSGLFALGDKPTSEQLQEWLRDRWLLRRSRASPDRRGLAG